MKSLFLLIFFTFNSFVFAQKKIPYIEFDFHHSIRFWYNNRLTIAIEHTGKRAKLKILKDSYIGEERLKEDSSVYLFKKEYERIVEEIQKINIAGMLNNLDFIGLDGTNTELIISDDSWNNTIELKFWTPDSDTEKRGLTHYYEACRLIIKAAGLDPDEYF